MYAVGDQFLRGLGGLKRGAQQRHHRSIQVRIKQMTGISSPIVKIPYEQAYEAGFEDMPRRVPDISKLRALVGYEPTVELDEILERVIDSLRTT